MKKTVLLAGAICLLGAQANADSYILNPYVSAKIRGSMMDNSWEERNSWTYGGTTYHENDSVSIDDSILGGSVALGLKTQLIKGSLRTEIEYNRNADAKKKHIGEDNDRYETKLKSEAFMLNAYYDIETNLMPTPYIGAGIGISRLKGSYSYDDYPSVNGSIKHTNLAWQIGTGVSYDINKNTTVDFGYRYIDYGSFSKTSTEKISGIDVNVKDEIESRAHEIMLGLRYTF